VNLSKIASLFFLLIGMIYTIMSIQLPDASIGRPFTPKIFPTALGVLMIVLSLGLLVKAFRTKTKPGETAQQTGFDVENVKQIGLTAVCALLYAVLFTRLGYVISTMLFLEGLLCVFNGPAKWKQNTLISVIFSVAVYVLFYKLLNVYLPPFPFFE
jgi:putative tricarboxylic transport membrane protein